MRVLLLLGLAGLMLVGSGCDRDEHFSFGVYNAGKSEIAEVAVAFPNGRTWPFGTVGSGLMAANSMAKGALPAIALVSWTDVENIVHKQRVQILPLPPAIISSTSRPEGIYFEIQPDGKVKALNIVSPSDQG